MSIILQLSVFYQSHTRIDIIRSSPKSKGKTVRIVSPHSSTSDSDDEHSSPTAFSTPSVQHKLGIEAVVPRFSAGLSAEAPADPFSAGSASGDTSEEDNSSESGQDAGVRPLDAPSHFGASNAQSSRTTLEQPASYNQNVSRESVIHPQPRASQALGTLDIPPNPFARTSPFAQGPTSKLVKDDHIITDSSSRSTASKNKPHLDVDAFKRLLLTGDKDGPTSAPGTPSSHVLPSQYMHGDSSSNTDASSLSRQSILDSQTDLRLETPRTSHEISPSEEERQFQLAARSPKSERFVPPVPRSRGSNAGKHNQPQSPILADAVLSTPTSKYSISSSPILATDLNKPLPPPPASDSSESRLQSSPVTLPSTDVPAPHSPVATIQRIRAAPPPPVSRRHSQYRSKYGSGSQAASTSIAEEHLADIHPDVPASATPKAPVPPPPPPRRRGTDRHQSLSDFPTVQSPATNIAQSTPISHGAKPPPPPSRTSSISSLKSKTRAPPSMSTSSSMVPPPPPRRRGSSGSSFGSRRVSSELQAMDMEGRNSNSTLPQSTNDLMPRGEANEKDIMADLSALQREVDALRGKYERRGSVGKA